MYSFDGFGTSVASECTWSTRGSSLICSWRSSTPSSTAGFQIPPSVGAWTTTKIGESSPWPNSSRTRSTACRDSVDAGRTSTVTPRISIQADGSASKPRTVRAMAMLATGRRITRAIVGASRCRCG